IGVVTPYRAQREWLASLARLPGVDVNTVDGFQGQERDVIIFTAVRTNTHGGIGFLSNARRLNVALTRARRKVVVVGD
ncbi:AAA domain-containing protein, partial [Pelagophyceae sp. CCMP2097]